MCVLKFIITIYSVIILHDISSSCVVQDRGTLCTTPNNETAICKSVYECSTILNVIKTKDVKQREFMRKSQCGYDTVPLVCCGTLNNYITDLKILNNKECGYQGNRKMNAGDGTEIDETNGAENSQMNEFPWSAILRYRNSTGDIINSCGGTLISRQYVLTAGRCAKIAEQTLLNVRLGEWNTKTNPDCISVGSGKFCNPEPEDINIESITVHGKFDPFVRSDDNDIAIIKLSRAVNYSNFIRPICLPPLTEDMTVGEILTATGWGNRNTYGNSEVKFKVPAVVLNKTECSNIYNVELAGGQLCSGGEQGKGSCTGDMGEPLMKKSKTDNSQWFIVGIFSNRRFCGQTDWPGIYTRISYYLAWIYANVKN